MRGRIDRETDFLRAKRHRLRVQPRSPSVSRSLGSSEGKSCAASHRPPPGGPQLLPLQNPSMGAVLAEICRGVTLTFEISCDRRPSICSSAPRLLAGGSPDPLRRGGSRLWLDRERPGLNGAKIRLVRDRFGEGKGDQVSLRWSLCVLGRLPRAALFPRCARPFACRRFSRSPPPRPWAINLWAFGPFSKSLIFAPFGSVLETSEFSGESGRGGDCEPALETAIGR